ncbi:hypothetical protein QCD79_34010, partial [Pseudomonas quasicaspiana]|nr:hypothetical protein [Pseudomonas quasicaspiana]
VLSLLEVEDFDALIMFVRTKQATLDLASALEAKGYKGACQIQGRLLGTYEHDQGVEIFDFQQAQYSRSLLV